MKNYPVILCIGTDLLSGDCLGPLVGYLLKENNLPAHVYGTLDSPVNALNLKEYINLIESKHKNSIVIAVDSCVGDDIGRIHVRPGPLKPGLAMNKTLPEVGDFSITATTSRTSQTDLGTVRLGFVFELAKRLYKIISHAILPIQYNNTTLEDFNQVKYSVI